MKSADGCSVKMAALEAENKRLTSKNGKVSKRARVLISKPAGGAGNGFNLEKEMGYEHSIYLRIRVSK